MQLFKSSKKIEMLYRFSLKWLRQKFVVGILVSFMKSAKGMVILRVWGHANLKNFIT